MEFFPPKMADAREESAPLKKGNPVGTYHRTGYLPISYCKETTALERTKYSVEASMVSWRNKCCLFPFQPCPTPFNLLSTPPVLPFLPPLPQSFHFAVHSLQSTMIS